MPKKMIIKGVGQFLAKKFSADGKGVEVITLGTLQSLKIDFNVEIDDIFGGDGLFAIDTLVKSKSIEISATDAKFDLDQLQLMMGSSVKEQTTTSLWVIGEQDTLVAGVLDPASSSVPVAQAVVDYGDSLFGDGNFSVRLKDSNKLLTRVPYSPTVAPKVDEVMIDSNYFAVNTTVATAATTGDTDVTAASAAGIEVGDTISVGGETVTVTNVAGAKITFTPALSADKVVGDPITSPASRTARVIVNVSLIAADVVYNYQRTAVGVDVLDILVDEVPFPVHVIHHGSYLQKDRTYAGVETELYSCIAMGQFSIDAQRATASSSAVALKVIDPERADGKLGSIKRFQSPKKV